MKRAIDPVTIAGLLLMLIISGCQAAASGRPYATPIPLEDLKGRAARVSVQTDLPRYNIDHVGLIVSNATQADITIPASQTDRVSERTFRFYKKTPLGWKRLQPDPGTLVVPLAQEPGLLVPAHSKIDVDITDFLGPYSEEFGAPLTGTFIAQVRYIRSDQFEFVQYSNEFPIDDTEPVTHTELNVNLVRAPSFGFTLQNNSNKPVWFSALCNNAAVAYGADDGYSTLQCLTEEGSWEPLYGECTRGIPPARVDPGKTLTVDGAPWFEKKLNDRPPGIYRWDVVLYLKFDPEHNDAILRDVRHIFSETFQYGQ